MLETLVSSYRKALYTAGLALSLYGCGDTTIVVNNYGGRDGGRPVANDVSNIIDGGNSPDGFFPRDAQQKSMKDGNQTYFDGRADLSRYTDSGSSGADLCSGELSNYPEMFVTDGLFNGYFVIGEDASSSDNLAGTYIAARMRYTNEEGESIPVTVVDAFKLDSEIASATAQNLIVLGNPCYNNVSAELLGNPADCDEGFTPGQGRIKLFQHANENYALLVAGYSDADTTLAAQVLGDRSDEISGDEVIVEGTTVDDATLRCLP